MQSTLLYEILLRWILQLCCIFDVDLQSYFLSYWMHFHESQASAILMKTKGG